MLRAAVAAAFLPLFAGVAVAACGNAGSTAGDDGGCEACAREAGALDAWRDASGAAEAGAAREAGAATDAPPDGAEARDGGPADAAPPLDAAPPPLDAAPPPLDAAPPPLDAAPPPLDAAPPLDASPADAAARDASPLPDSSGGGPITGGPCLSGASGATAVRIRFIDAGGEAQVSYEAFGLPDASRDKAGAYGYTFGFIPQYVDPFLAQGGLQLDSSDFVDLELSTVGLSSITSATLSIYGRSYSVDTDGSFEWQTFVDSGATPTDFVSNVPPYRWYSADVLAAVNPGDSNVLVRIKAGPSSGALVVNAIELCLVAR